jgi:MoaA/NifB/PqqE/SkfB family radical SAM enzyme/SAM-dependent methyltransferase
MLNPYIELQVSSRPGQGGECIGRRPDGEAPPARGLNAEVLRGDRFFTAIATKPPLTKLHPRLVSFFKDYFSREKAVRFGDHMVVNTHFPPYPSRAFDQLAEGFRLLGDANERRLYSVDVAVTNRCPLRCAHCYNAGRRQADLPVTTHRRVARELQDRGAVMVTLTGGEPLLRHDLETIVGAYDDRSCVIVGTTGAGLSPERARRLREAGLFGIGVSLDSSDETEHDRLRGRRGAFHAALRAIQTARDAGLYAYAVSVATRGFLRRERFEAFLRFAGSAGALEVNLLEPVAVGRWAGRSGVQLTPAERQSILDWQARAARRDDLPIVSSYAYLESAEAFGCGAGLTHLYIDGAGEVCPCQFVPLSFGNVAKEPLDAVFGRLAQCFERPRMECVACTLARHMEESSGSLSLEASTAVCEKHLPRAHPLPRFFRIHAEANDEVGAAEVSSAYDRIHEDYETHWLSRAAEPIQDLVERLRWTGRERVFEAGCGTGYATALLAERAANVLAVDLSDGMLGHARRRVGCAGAAGVQFRTADALDALQDSGLFDVVFSSWVLGYIPLAPFFHAARRALVAGGRLAFVIHQEHSPRVPLEIFASLVARDPSVLRRRVAFDFPQDGVHLRAAVASAGFGIESMWNGTVVFRYSTPEAVLDHLLKSGAGTAFYDAVDPARRADLTADFLQALEERNGQAAGYTVSHEYVACIARKPSGLSATPGTQV